MKTKKIHYQHGRSEDLALCGAKADSGRDTEEIKKVTCLRCKRLLRVQPSQRWAAK